MNVAPSGSLATTPSTLHSQAAAGVPYHPAQRQPEAELRRIPPVEKSEPSQHPEAQQHKHDLKDADARIQRQVEQQQQKQIAQLAARDREVRAHEQAHAAVGGIHAGPPQYSFERGPNGRSYAVSGEVQISTSPVPGDPQATIEKAEQVRRAALAPAQPSTQDRQVAAQATQMKLQAQLELNQEGQEQRTESVEPAAADRRSEFLQARLQTASVVQATEDFQRSVDALV